MVTALIASMSYQPIGYENDLPKLSKEEKEVLTLLYCDYSQKEIAAIKNVTCSTIGTYIERLKEKFGVRTITALIGRAVRWGMI